jgi:hypothetical protein
LAWDDVEKYYYITLEDHDELKVDADVVATIAVRVGRGLPDDVNQCSKLEEVEYELKLAD